MKREEIEAMEAGRALDVLVATKVMGLVVGRLREIPPDADDETDYTVYVNDATGEEMSGLIYGGLCRGGEPMDGRHIVPRYSKDIAAAWGVVGKLQPKFGFALCDTLGHPPWTAEFIDAAYFVAEADTPMLAICKAALKAVMK